MSDRRVVEIDEELCDGCGACIPSCHEGAIRLIDGKARLAAEKSCDGLGACLGTCPRGAIRLVEREETPPAAGVPLSHWPVQIRLVSPMASFLRQADLVVAADCVPVAYPRFQQEMVRDHVVLIGCPKFDDLQEYTVRFSRLFAAAPVRRIQVVVMEVPCCQSLPIAVQRGLAMAGCDLPVEVLVVGTRGDLVGRRTLVPGPPLAQSGGCCGGRG